MLRHRLLDRMVLKPTRHPLDAGDQSAFYLETAIGKLQLFRQHFPHRAADSRMHDRPDRLIIKWPGNAGRAENSTPHPANVWPEESAEIWTVNPHGYGASEGSASLLHVPNMAQAVWHHARETWPDTPTLLFGNSIGCVTAIYQAVLAQDSGQAIGLLLRNPPPLMPLLNGHYHRWFYGPATHWLTASLPDALDSILQARQCHLPLVMLQSQNDSVVPARFQDMIFDDYAGPKTRISVPGLEHEDLPEGSWLQKYLQAIQHQFSQRYRSD